MEQHFKDAFALVETQGMVPAIYAADAMLKAANVEPVSYTHLRAHET